MSNLTNKKIHEMIEKGRTDEVFDHYISEFNNNVEKTNYPKSYLAKLALLNWVKVAGQTPDRMKNALKEHLS